jgi:ABC-2 type transport system permease protein
VRGSPLPFLQSLLVAWPQITALVAAVIALFALTYVLFQRQEIRA